MQWCHWFFEKESLINHRRRRKSYHTHQQEKKLTLSELSMAPCTEPKEKYIPLCIGSRDEQSSPNVKRIHIPLAYTPIVFDHQLWGMPGKDLARRNTCIDMKSKKIIVLIIIKWFSPIFSYCLTQGQKNPTEIEAITKCTYPDIRLRYKRGVHKLANEATSRSYMLCASWISPTEPNLAKCREYASSSFSTVPQHFVINCLTLTVPRD